MKKVDRVKIVAWIRDWFEKNGPDAPAVIGISGGKDSTVLAALCAEALGPNRVIGVMMPNGVQKDIADSIKVVETLGIKSITVNIKGIIDAINTASTRPVEYRYTPDMAIFGNDNTVTLHQITPQATMNLPPRIRMSILYYVSQTVGGRVIDTTNLSEELIGWGTRWGDLVGDVSPLRNITATEVVQLGLDMELPKELVVKAPSDGLCGQTDEDKFGFTYAQLDACIRDEEADIDDAVKKKILTMYKNSEFKREPIPAPSIHEIEV